MVTLVDTSFWIDYGRGKLTTAERQQMEGLWRSQNCLLYQYVWLELIAGFRSPKERRWLADYRAVSRWKPMEEADAAEAESLAGILRQAGLNIPASDLLILAAAERSEARLIHHDGDFEAVLALPRFSHLAAPPP